MTQQTGGQRTSPVRTCTARLAVFAVLASFTVLLGAFPGRPAAQQVFDAPTVHPAQLAVATVPARAALHGPTTQRGGVVHQGSPRHAPAPWPLTTMLAVVAALFGFAAVGRGRRAAWLPNVSTLPQVVSARAPPALA